MAIVLDANAEYRSATTFRAQCFSTDRSYLWPSQSVWTVENIKTLLAAYMGRLDERGGLSFLQKWQEQLSDQRPEIHRLAAEVLIFYYIFPSSGVIRKIKKLEKIRAVISWKLRDDEPAPEILENTFGSGIGDVGTHYLASQPFEIAYYLEFVKAGKERSISFEDESACKALADEIRARSQDSSEARAITLHLLFPNAFEPIVSMRHRKAITSAFAHHLDGATDEDDALRQIRLGLADELGPNFSYYDPATKKRWLVEKSPVQTKEIETPPTESKSDRTIKSDLAFDYLKTLPARFYKGKDEIWESLRQTHPDVFEVSVARKTPWQTLNRDMREDARFSFRDGAFALREWHLSETDIDRIAQSIRSYLESQSAYQFEPLHNVMTRAVGLAQLVLDRPTIEEEVYNQILHDPMFLHRDKQIGLTQWPLTESYFVLMRTSQDRWEDRKGEYHCGPGASGNWHRLFDATDSGKVRFVIYQPGSGEIPYSFLSHGLVTGWTPGSAGTDRNFQLEEIEFDGPLELKGPDNYLLDDLDLTKSVGLKAFSQRAIVEISADDYNRIVEAGEGIDPNIPPGEGTGLTIDIAEGLTVGRTIITRLVTLLNKNQNVILTGAPGTAKTTLALRACNQALELGWSGEPLMTTATADWSTFDTIGGYMPVPATNKLRFTEGIILQALRQNRWLIIDEINRADIDKAFGQMLTVFSGHAVTLSYSNQAGQLIRIEPTTKAKSSANVERGIYYVGNQWRILATMNTFDKNTLFALSYALMRRFAFVHLPRPTPGQRHELLAKFAPDDVGWLETMLDPVQDRIGPAQLLEIGRFVGGSIDVTRSQLALDCLATYVVPQLQAYDNKQLSRAFGTWATILEPSERNELEEMLMEICDYSPTPSQVAQLTEDGNDAA